MPGASTYACQQHKIYARTVQVCKSRHAHAQYVCVPMLYIEGHQKKPMPTYQCVKTVGGHAAETEHVPEG